MMIISNLTKPIVLISKCNNIFRNLALEDLIYNNYNKIGFPNENFIILLWKNEPCVVVGRHQNVWAEVNISRCIESYCDIARRRSGGGTVYHDLDNINFTFFTNRNKYNQRQNLQLINTVLKDQFQIDCDINCRNDLVLKGNMKISGSAAKLGSKIAYHHFTLLINSDLKKINYVLDPFQILINSRATNSIRSRVTNLNQFIPNVATHKVFDIMAKHLTRQVNAELITTTLESDQQLDQLEKELKNWNWVFGHTPNFQIKKLLKSNNSLPWTNELVITMQIENGIIKEIKFEGAITNKLFDQMLTDFSSTICGCKFLREDITLGINEFVKNIFDIRTKEWIHFLSQNIIDASLGL